MRMRLSSLVCLALLTYGCDGGSGETEVAQGQQQPAAQPKSAETPKAEPAKPKSDGPELKDVALIDADAEALGCDVKTAKRIFKQCKVCHTYQDGAGNLTGPNLFGVLDRPAAALEGFAYSPVLRKAELVWTEDVLDGFLAKPPKYLPGNRMAFGGVRKDEARAAVICYLKAL